MSDNCRWCEEPLGDFPYQPWPGVWVHRTCDEWAWGLDGATFEELGEYLDKVRPV